MSWLKQLLGGGSAPPEGPASEPGGLGTLESLSDDAGTILLDTGRAVRVRASDLPDREHDRGARVEVERIERRDGASWAVGVRWSDVAFRAREIDLAANPPVKPPPDPPEVIEARRRAYAEGQAALRKTTKEQRGRWRERIGSQSLEDRRARIGALLEAQSLGRFKDGVSPLPAIRCVALLDESTEPQQSRLGGRPWMPEDVAWPAASDRPLSFLAQIRLDELPKDAVSSELPRTGHLLFFYDAIEQPWGFEPEDAQSWKVLFVSGGRELRDFPDALGDEARFAECRLTFGSTLTLPSAFSARAPELATDADIDAYWEVHRALEEDELDVPAHQIGGWPRLIQSDMEEQCQLCSSGVRMGSPKDHEATYRPGLEEGAEDWILLFQVDTDEVGPGWMWGDCGTLYYWIKKQDLAVRDFTSVWLILQCT
jgi:uncharacterized protein YwqG